MDIESNKKIYIDLICYPLNVLGPDTRVGIWFQGCDIGCDGCISQYTWKQTDDKLKDLDDVVLELKQYKTNRLTISGGEPFFQPDSLYTLILKVRDKFDDILLYSGYEYSYLNKKYPHILNLIDVLVDGKFNKDLPTKEVYKGSSNQKIYIFNQKLMKKYIEYINKKKDKLEIFNKDDDLYILGIPNIQDTKQIQEILNGENKNE